MTKVFIHVTMSLDGFIALPDEDDGFKKGDKEFLGIWEQSMDGKNWIHFMDIKLTKAD